ncbi:DUF3592 domain-containing protein [Blastococcus sp. PRF04-17]|uniref:DUF3592 domain-containing protein n=1 Tax=Blastococcus sp. PRF04-17 TaxID=2933797 RepID=UPI001FF4754C|nr:DUF3592 domain-containing protein [Blastococcus sp. PRF04-17]UOX99857.1 DUF3592 domain-containing protein [Blastococcus sp. PRF04-17]
MRSGSSRRPWWAIGFLTLGSLWMLLVGCLFLTGYWATVTVTDGAGAGFCDVVWEDPSGRRLSGESDCHDEPPGSRFEVRVSGWPDAGEPTLTGTYVGMGLAVGLPPSILGGGRLVQLAWRRRLRSAPELETRTALEGFGRALEDPRTATAMRQARRRAWALAGLGAVGIGGVVVAFSVDIGADDELRRTGVTTVGTVEWVEPDSKWSDGAASVRFTAGGSTESRDVTLGGFAADYVAGDVVDVWYDPADPDRFIIDDALYGPDWTGWVLVPALVLALLAPFGFVRLTRSQDMSRLLDSRSWARVRVDVTDLQDRLRFTTVDGSDWRTGRYWLWLPHWAGHDPTGAAEDELAWWVSDGATAVFSPDPGRVLVLARRR